MAFTEINSRALACWPELIDAVSARYKSRTDAERALYAEVTKLIGQLSLKEMYELLNVDVLVYSEGLGWKSMKIWELPA